MPGRLRRYLALDRSRRRLLWPAWFALGTARIKLMLTPLKKMTEGLARHEDSASTPGLKAPDAKQARDVGWAVQAASTATPWNSSCLVQVLAAQKMLQRRGIPGVFYIGAAPGENPPASSRLEAHAWLICGSDVITGEPGHERFTVLAAFSWPAH